MNKVLWPAKMDLSRYLLGLFYLIVAVALACMVWGLWPPYSYWIDEIFSVVAARETLPDMFSHWLLMDVHPPLYQIILNGWVALFGMSEPATRTLSVLFGVAVVVTMILAVYRKRDLLLWGILVLSLPWFAYFSQEARPYILLYFLGVMATLAMVHRRDGFLWASLVLMAWVHYFGLLLALSLLFAKLICVRRVRLGDVLAGVLMLTWLPLHLMFGSVLGKAGHFWIKVDSPGGTLANFFGVVSPGFSALWKSCAPVSVAYAAGILFVLLYFPYQHFVRKKPAELVDLWFSLALLVFVVGIVVVDQVVPMSTPRNFLVAMPAFLYILACVAKALLSLRWQLYVLIPWVVLQISAMVMLMHYKQSEFENYRRATLAMLSLMDHGYTGYYLEPCQGNQGYNSDAMSNLYMDMLDDRQRKLKMICRQELKANLPNAVILDCQPPGAILVPGYEVMSMDEKGWCKVIRSR